jgi:hypothetical protein
MYSLLVENRCRIASTFSIHPTHDNCSRPGSVCVSTKGLASFLVFPSHSEAKCRVLKTICSWQNAIITWRRSSSVLIAAIFIREIKTALREEGNLLPASVFRCHYNKLYSEFYIKMQGVIMTLYGCLLYVTLNLTLSILDTDSVAYLSVSVNFSLDPTHFSRSTSDSFTHPFIFIPQFLNHSFHHSSFSLNFTIIHSLTHHSHSISQSFIHPLIILTQFLNHSFTNSSLPLNFSIIHSLIHPSG